MKRTKNNLIVAIIATLSFISGMVNGQDTTNEQNEKRELAKNFKIINKAIEDSTFVIEANLIRGKHTYNYFVSPNTNFVKINKNKIVIQTASAHHIGPNGLGGTTINGKIITYELFKDKNSIRALIQFTSPIIGITTVNIDVYATGNGDATINTATGSYVVFDGYIKRLNDSSAFEGISIF